MIERDTLSIQQNAENISSIEGFNIALPARFTGVPP